MRKGGAEGDESRIRTNIIVRWRVRPGTSVLGNNKFRPSPPPSLLALNLLFLLLTSLDSGVIFEFPNSQTYGVNGEWTIGVAKPDTTLWNSFLRGTRELLLFLFLFLQQLPERGGKICFFRSVIDSNLRVWFDSQRISRWILSGCSCVKRARRDIIDRMAIEKSAWTDLTR